MTTVNDVPVIIIGGAHIDPRAVKAAVEACRELGEAFIHLSNGVSIEFHPENTNIGLSISHTEMLDRAILESIKPELEPVKNDPFWTQGRKKKGGRRRY